MKQINNDREFRQAIEALDVVQQREVAATFVDHVLPLCEQRQLSHILTTARDRDASEAEMAMALKSAHALAIDCHARCGAEGHWSDQAGYFVARAAVAATTSAAKSRVGGPAWQAAMSARMAHTSMLIEDLTSEQLAHTESEWQYQCLSDYLQELNERN
jgi:hypothetical protein